MLRDVQVRFLSSALHTAEIAQLVEHNLAKVGVASSSLVFRSTYCGNSSVGRAQPCQGWGREFESRFPLNKNPELSGFFCFMVFAILSAAYEEQDHGNDNQREVSQF